MNVSKTLLFTCSLTSLLFVAAVAGVFTEQPEPAPIHASGTVCQSQPEGGAHDASSARDVVRSAGYTAAPGTRLGYEVRFAMGLALESAGSQTPQPANQPVVIAAEGSLQLVVLGRLDAELLVGYRPGDLRVSVPAGTQHETAVWCGQLERALQQGFDVRMSERGRPTAMRFLGAWTVEQRNFARAIVSAFRFEFQDTGTWSTQFDDTMGHHAFDYRAEAEGDGVSLVRTRAGFVPKGSQGDSKADVRLSGSAAAHFAPAVGWLGTATVEDQLSWAWVDGALRVSSWLRATMQCTHADSIAVEAEWQHGFVDVSGAHEASTVTEDPLRNLWDEKLQGLDVAAVLRRLQALLALQQEPSQEYMELLQMLAELMRRDPAEADRLAALIQSAQVTGQAAADVLAAIGMAGHEQAQAALTTVFENGLVEAALRQAAVEAMIQIAQPDQQLIDSLRRSLHGVDQLANLQGSAMLVLGAFGSRGATTTEGLSLATELLAFEATARRDGLEAAYFEALGNTGDAAVLPLAQRLLQSSDPLDRERALTVLRRVTSPAADELLRSCARDDHNADVRRHAVQTIGESTAAWTRDVLIERAAGDSDAEVRRVAYSGLAMRARTDAVARTALRQRLGAERDPDLRQMLQSLLGAA